MLGMATTMDAVTTGVREITEALGGGIREGSLAIIEGEAKTGKSVLCQHIACGVLSARQGAVAYYSTEYGSEALLEQMDSMSLNVSHDFTTDRFRVYRMGNRDVLRDAAKSLQLIINHILELPERFKLVIVDSPSLYMTSASSVIKMDFLQRCKELCEQNRTIITVLDSHVIDGKTHYRAHAISDYYLKLASQDMILAPGQVDTRIIKVLEVTKMRGAERHAQPDLKFEIKPKVGIQILPLVKIRV
jgi:flagellar protein FlaH